MHRLHHRNANDGRQAAAFACVCCFAHASGALAADPGTSGAPGVSSPTPQEARAAVAPDVARKSTAGIRATAPVVSVTGAAPGQAGYVHFFIVRAPGGEWETQVGIEMPDQRIAWSFFELGVVVSPFIESGHVPANRKLIEVQYLYGLRPFPDAASMQVLRAELESRVQPWVESETPYCIVRGPSDPVCLSCLSFVLRILFPDTARIASQRDAARAALKSIYTTDDLLLYLAGMQGISNRDARLKRVSELALPQNLRDEIVRLIEAGEGSNDTADATSATGKPPARRLAKPARRTVQPGKT